MIEVTAGAATHVGLVRSGNEDSHLSGHRVWAVADGMGGHAAGEVASRVAIERLRELDALPGDLVPIDVVAAIQQANGRVVAEGRRNGATGMGTTVTGLALVADDEAERLCVFNVGDSRVYRYTRGRLVQVTTDHSEVAEMVALGLISPLRARTHPLRHIVTRCLGGPVPQVDTVLVKPRTGDRFVVCSDGLNGELTDRAIAALCKENSDASGAAAALVTAAVEAGGSDNVTVIVCDIAVTEAD